MMIKTREVFQKSVFMEMVGETFEKTYFMIVEKRKHHIQHSTKRFFKDIVEGDMQNSIWSTTEVRTLVSNQEAVPNLY